MIFVVQYNISLVLHVLRSKGLVLEPVCLCVCVCVDVCICVCVCVDVCVHFDSLDPVYHVCLCVFTGLFCIGLCINMLWMQNCYVWGLQVRDQAFCWADTPFQ